MFEYSTMPWIILLFHQDRILGSNILVIGRNLSETPKEDSKQPKDNVFGRKSKGRSILHPTFNWRTFKISAVILAIFFGVGIYLKREKDMLRDRERRRSLGKAAIGGSFELLDQDGKPFTSNDLLGKWYIIYFGFSHCPDICPEEMEKMVQIINNCEKMDDLPTVLPVFISVDPDRDTPPIVKKYIGEYSSKIIGLTGSKEQVDRATRAYRVYYSVSINDLFAGWYDWITESLRSGRTQRWG